MIKLALEIEADVDDMSQEDIRNVVAQFRAGFNSCNNKLYLTPKYDWISDNNPKYNTAFPAYIAEETSTYALVGGVHND